MATNKEDGNVSSSTSPYNKAGLIFATPTSSNVASIGVLTVRIGIAFGFFWASSGKLMDPAMFGETLQKMAGMDPAMAVSMATLIGSLELISGILILFGIITRPAAAFQITVLVAALIMFGFDFTKGPAIWKDPAMLGAVIMLILYGAGRFSIDYKIAKLIDR